MKTEKPQPRATLTQRIVDWATASWDYFWTGVWSDRRDTLWVRILKVINLAIRSFSDRGLQTRSMSLTYTTVLALVPAFALLFAIGRGFGFQNILHDELFNLVPSQQKALETTFSFVDSYLANASQGIFVGVGLVVLLWTVISLLSSVEDAFNQMWGIKESRSFLQKLSDYISICLIVPVLMICSSGVSIFMSTTVQAHLHLHFLTPLVNVLIDILPFVLIWVACAFAFAMVPNTKVQPKYAAIAATITCIALQILQILFVNGQIYVSKYNAIYGTFAFLPLMLVWLQLSWLIVLSGCMLTYTLQNVFAFNYTKETEEASEEYLRQVTLVLTAIIFKRQKQGMAPLSVADLASTYDLPVRLVNRIIDRLHQAAIIYKVVEKRDRFSYAPAIETATFTVADLFERLDRLGAANFIPSFDERYAQALALASSLFDNAYAAEGTQIVADLPISMGKE